MRTKRLGRTELEVPIVGLGTVFIGGQAEGGAPGELDVERGIETVVAALEAGCTLIDTAPLYGGTVSETIIGKALAERPDLAAGVTVTTKVGRTLEGRDYGYDAVKRSVEASQARIGREHFDIVFIHDPMGMPFADVLGPDRAMGALRSLRDEGVVRFIGMAANDAVANGPFIETGEFDVAVVPDAWSLLNQSAARLVFPAVEMSASRSPARCRRRARHAHRAGPAGDGAAAGRDLPQPRVHARDAGACRPDQAALRRPRRADGGRRAAMVRPPSPGGDDDPRRPHAGGGCGEYRGGDAGDTGGLLGRTGAARPRLQRRGLLPTGVGAVVTTRGERPTGVEFGPLGNFCPKLLAVGTPRTHLSTK